MNEKEQRGHPGSEKEAQRNDPQEGDRLLQRRPPVITQLSLPADVPQIVRRLDDVIDVDADAEHVGEHRIAARQAQHPDAKRGRERVRDDRHTRGATGGAADGAGSREPPPVTPMRTKPPANQAKTRTPTPIECNITTY